MITNLKPQHFLHSFSKALKYYTFSKHSKGYSIHSPFVYKLIKNTFLVAKNKTNLNKAKNLRTEFINDKTIIDQTNRGAGSRLCNESRKSTIGKLTKQSGLSPKYISLLTTMAHQLEYKDILELGTCTGLTTTALAEFCPTATITTIENAKDRATWAVNNFEQRKLSNITLLQEDFDTALNEFARQQKHFDMIFIDGNHTFSATVRYFEKLKPLIKINGLLIFDDIYWSGEMTHAWQQIQKVQSIGITIDLYRMGLLFRRENQHKEHFTIRY